MSSRPPSESSETSPLLGAQRLPQSYDACDDDDAASLPPSPQQEFTPSNKVSNYDLAWVLAGLWSAVFLGALDGASPSLRVPPRLPRLAQPRAPLLASA